MSTNSPRGVTNSVQARDIIDSEVHVGGVVVNVGAAPEPRPLKILLLGPVTYVPSEHFLALPARLSNEGGTAIKVLEVALEVDGRWHRAAQRSEFGVADYPWFNPPDVRIEAHDGATGAWYFGPSWGGTSREITPGRRTARFRLLAQHTEPIEGDLAIVDYKVPASAE